MMNESTEKDLQAEFCLPEKQAYMNWMRTKCPVEYENLMKIEEGNY